MHEQLKEEQIKFEKKSEDLHNQRLEFWSKKKVGFVNLKSWHEERKSILALQKKILEHVFAQTIDKMKQSARESQKIVQYFLSVSEMERDYSENIDRNIKYMADIKQCYQNYGKGYLDLCDGVETYEKSVAQDHLFASKEIKQLVDETLGALFKKQIQKIEEFTLKVSKLFKKLLIDEKECDKAYQNFTNMLSEAEVSMNHHRLYDKDFWLAENSCLVTNKIHYDRQHEICKEILGIWSEAEATEEVKIRNFKQLYENFIIKCLITTENSKRLKLVIDSSNEEAISSKIYSFKNMFVEEDLKSMSHLMELLGENIDFLKAETSHIKLFLENITISEAPQTTFIVKEGKLKRDPGFMKSWKTVI
jgi:hypothetical protein